MDHFGCQLEEEVVGNGEEYAVGRLVDVDGAEFSVVLRYESRVRWHYPVLAVAYLLIHQGTCLGCGELIERGFVDVAPIVVSFPNG